MKKILFLWLTLFLYHPAFSIAEPAGENNLEIGMSLPLSGDLAGIGTAVSNGIGLAIEEWPGKFSELTFIFDDNRYDPKSTLSSFEQMKQRSQLQLVYVWGSPTCMAVAPVAEREHRPLVCFSGDPKPGLHYVVSFNNPAADYAAIMAGRLHSDSSGAAALVYSDIPFYGNLADALEQETSPAKLAYRESVLPSSQDFSTIVSKLKARQVKTLALFLLPHQMPTFSKQMAVLNYRPMIIGADSFSDVEAIEASNGVLDDAVYVDMRVDSAFKIAYFKKYRNTSNLAFAYNGYRFALALSDILQGEKRPISTEELLSRFKSYASPGFEKSDAISFKHNDRFGQYFSFPIELKKVSDF